MRSARLLSPLLLVFSSWLASDAGACPFCEAQQPTLSQRRAAAAVFALCDVLEIEGPEAQPDRKPGKANSPQGLFRVQKLLTGSGVRVAGQPAAVGNEWKLSAPTEARQGDLYLAIGVESAEKVEPRPLEWSFERLDETSFAYVARSPAATVSTAERLKYFGRFLESDSPVAAGDAYLEFAHAPLTDVESAAGDFAREKLQAWLVDPQVPDRRKGLYGLLLGLVARQSGREADREFLAGLVDRPRDDFRAGYDGILGGYLWAAGEPALDRIERKLLADPKAADGDVRHAAAALRFYWEHGRQIPPDRLRAAMRHLLARPEFARTAIIDLARWQDWGALARVTGLYEKPAYADPGIQRAIIGFVLTCPEPAAAAELARLRKLDPARVSETERQISILGGVR